MYGCKLGFTKLQAYYRFWTIKVLNPAVLKAKSITLVRDSFFANGVGSSYVTLTRASSCLLEGFNTISCAANSESRT